jgi:hypothetical protein
MDLQPIGTRFGTPSTTGWGIIGLCRHGGATEMRLGSSWRVALLALVSTPAGAQTTDEAIYSPGTASLAPARGPFVILGVAAKQTRITEPAATHASATVRVFVPPGTELVLVHLTGWRLGYGTIDLPDRFFDYSGINVYVTDITRPPPGFFAQATIRVDVELTGRHSAAAPTGPWFALAHYQLIFLGRPAAR